MTKEIIITFFIALFLVLIIDFLWLGLIAKKFYNNELKNLSKEKYNLVSAIFVYILLATGIVFFVLNNNLSTNYLSVLIIGALFGLVTYGVYDLTNMAIVKNWPIKLTIVDIIWGSFLCGVVSLTTKYLSDFIK